MRLWKNLLLLAVFVHATREAPMFGLRLLFKNRRLCGILVASMLLVIGSTGVVFVDPDQYPWSHLFRNHTVESDAEDAMTKIQKLCINLPQDADVPVSEISDVPKEKLKQWADAIVHDRKHLEDLVTTLYERGMLTVLPAEDRHVAYVKDDQLKPLCRKWLNGILKRGNNDIQSTLQQLHLQTADPAFQFK